MDSEEEQASHTFSYTIRPPFVQKFNPVAVKEIIRSVLIDELGGRKYNSFDPSEMSKNLYLIILQKLNDMPFKRYKYVIHVLFAEQKGQGMSLSSGAKWDPDTDNFATEILSTMKEPRGWMLSQKGSQPLKRSYVGWKAVKVQ